jgi:penicillin-binding protein 1C
LDNGGIAIPSNRLPSSDSHGEAGNVPARKYWRIATFVALGVLLFSLVSVCLGLSAFGALYLYYSQGLPPSARLDVQQLSRSVKIFDRTGTLLYEVTDPEGGHRSLVQPTQIPRVMKQAVIATEDPTFYSNWGIDGRGVLRAIYYQLRYGRVVGGSTITQQLVKNLFLDPEPTVQRKIREAFLALEITRRYPKEQVLAAYLNAIYFGNLAYGIQAASQSYFNQDVSQLDLAEASLLAGLPQAPSLYDPCDNPGAALARQRTVLGLMVQAGDISASQSAAAANEMENRLRAPEFMKRCRVEPTLKAPHFVTYVRQQLEAQFGPEVLYHGGLQVTTSLDPRLQAIAEQEAKKQIAALQGKNVSNAAVLILNPQTGEILAMVGSVDFFDEAIAGQVNMALAPRQPGSSIKPLNYITAFKGGWTPGSPIYDLKTNFPDGNNRPPYAPVNYDGKYHGLVSARTALASSLNIPAVKTLYLSSTPDENNFPQPLAMLDTARTLGITTFSDAQGRPRQPYGLALTLGGGEVRLLELTGTYATFANQGERIPPVPYLKIDDAKGKVLFDLDGKDKPKPQCARFEPNAPNEQPGANGLCASSAPFAYLITSILSDDDARSMGFGRNGVLKLSRPAAVKTGTTDDFHDNWTIGYTPDLVVGVWVGNADNSPMRNVSGISGAAPIWHDVMERALANTPVRDFTVPPGIVQAEICIDSGLLATPLCPRARHRVEFFVSGHAPTELDTVWRRVQCSPGQFSPIFVVPVHDVGDLIPYDQILDWAKGLGAPVLPPEANPCAGSVGGHGNGRGEYEKDDNHGNGRGKKH